VAIMRTIESKQNPRLKELRKAIARPGAVAGIEGPNLVEEALHAGLKLTSLFVADDFAHTNADWLNSLPLEAHTEVLLVERSLLSSVLATEAPQPVAALVAPPTFTWANLLPAGQPALLLILAGLQDPGNMGTILRSAEAFGATGVVALPGTVSPWNGKAVRASAGSLFRLPFLSASVQVCFGQLRAAQIPIWTTDVYQARPIADVDFSKSIAVLIGNEGKGVPADIAAEAQAALTIPCPGPVESLNAAVASSILLYEASRQRAATARKGAR